MLYVTFRTLRTLSSPAIVLDSDDHYVEIPSGAHQGALRALPGRRGVDKHSPKYNSEERRGFGVSSPRRKRQDHRVYTLLCIPARTLKLAIDSLDECEKFQHEYNQELYEDKKVSVRFHGILEIQRLTWLTPDAHAAIEEELRARDLAARPRSNPDARSSTLTLKNLYSPGSHLKVKVKIQGTQANSAVYLFCRCYLLWAWSKIDQSHPQFLANDVPTGLLITT